MMTILDCLRTEKAWLLANDGERRKVFPLYEQDLIIGRSDRMPLHLDALIVAKKRHKITIANLGTTQQIGFDHVQLHWDREARQYLLRSLFPNETYVNGEMVAEVPLHDEDQFTLGKLMIAEERAHSQFLGENLYFQIQYCKS